MATMNEIRRQFLDYFVEHGHAEVASSSLVPSNDPTLLFANSGMVQFKNLFTGVERRDYTRAVTSQKCVRAGGKHNDLDNVGYTARHHTFFEMLGNFSFGDYFKEEAISRAWELVTGVYDLPKDKLLVTVFSEDDEAAALWRKIAGLSDDRIIRISTSDNFWTMGPTGPCGPCSEIFFDHGEGIFGGPPGSADEDGDRFIEIWNLVFMQFDQINEETRLDLPRPSIDTGMGLERIAAVLQGKHDNYDTDLMRSLIVASAQATGTEPDGPQNIHHRVIADHLRSTSFLMADGVIPSNEGRGYVLRRIMRRAMRHAHLIGVDAPLMHRLVPSLTSQMGDAFPELRHAQSMIVETLRSEEERFRKTLDRGLRLLDDEVSKLGEGQALSGAVAFKLYDTYGFPLDLTQDALREQGRGVDLAGFDAAMAEQKSRARAAWSGAGDSTDESVWFDIAEAVEPTEFLGYDRLVIDAQVVAIVKDGAQVERLATGETGDIIVNQTPFYAESGGQVGDQGRFSGAASGSISDTRKRIGKLFAHVATLEKGAVAVGDTLTLSVDAPRRQAIRANHSATHLLHEALRGALGDHVAQRGSLVAPDRLRFDFTHQKALSDEELNAIALEVNRYVRQNDDVNTRLMTPDEAQEIGARALFGEKYGDEVRVVSMGARPSGDTGPAGGTYSLELCGGTHVEHTGEIGLFAVIAEGASSAGVRRVEAVTGDAALREMLGQAGSLGDAAGLLKARPAELPDRVRALLDERKALQAEMAELRKKLALAEAGPAAEPKEVAGTLLVAQAIEGVSAKDLRDLATERLAQLGEGVVVLVADTGGKAAVTIAVSDGLAARFSAVDLVKVAAEALGGKGGGGRPTLAQAGGADATKSDTAFAAVEAMMTQGG